MRGRQRIAWFGLLIFWLLNGCLSSTKLTPSMASTSVTAGSPVITPLPSPRSTAILPSTAAILELGRLLAANGGCSLPCVWGITPGVSSLADAEAVLRPMGSIASYPYSESASSTAIEVVYPESGLGVYARVTALAEGATNRVEEIRFGLRALRSSQGSFQGVYDSPDLMHRMQYYMASGILDRYGAPEKVLISTQSRPSGHESGVTDFSLLLLYPDLGMLVRYSTTMAPVGEDIRGCFTSPDAEFWLYPSGRSKGFMQALEDTFWTQFAPGRFKTLQSATSLSVEGFYQAFREPATHCIVSPADLWPAPDP